MTRDSGVSYEAVRRACCAILANGGQPSRPSVQEMLAQADYLGHKGSNAVVQGFISQFRREMAGILSQPERTVPGVPDEYVALQDKMLVEMVAVTRQIVASEFKERESQLETRRRQMDDIVEEARQATGNADQLRIRAEGERDAMHAAVHEWKTRSKAQMVEIQALGNTVKARDETISLQTQALGHAQSMLDDSRLALEEQKTSLASIETRYREELGRLSTAAEQERARLLQQVDDIKQTTKREAKVLNDIIGPLQTSVETLQCDLSAVRERNASMVARIDSLMAMVKRFEDEGKRLLSVNQALEREKITVQVRLETAETLRQEASGRVAGLEAELAGLRAQVRYAAAVPLSDAGEHGAS